MTFSCEIKNVTAVEKYIFCCHNACQGSLMTYLLETLHFQGMHIIYIDLQFFIISVGVYVCVCVHVCMCLSEWLSECDCWALNHRWKNSLLFLGLNEGRLSVDFSGTANTSSDNSLGNLNKYSRTGTDTYFNTNKWKLKCAQRSIGQAMGMHPHSTVKIQDI